MSFRRTSRAPLVSWLSVDPPGLSQNCLLGVSGPHTWALSPGPGIAQARPKPGKLGPGLGGVEAAPEDVCRVSQSRWGAVVAHMATAAAAEEAQVPPH